MPLAFDKQQSLDFYFLRQIFPNLSMNKVKFHHYFFLPKKPTWKWKGPLLKANPESHKKSLEQVHIRGFIEDNTVINWKHSPLCICFYKIMYHFLLKAFTLRVTWFLALAALCTAVIPSLALKSKCAPPFFRAFITSTALSSWTAKVRGVSKKENTGT